ncbi:hypothetical protein K469DRAFT_334447 [Zopfia rhizophila CBS 207.26]|uniref:Uncharacterized protein n=1 Tax=Zopfia rhizophila CBS 207.26 TaxID=1314779 RepID=A0A6A6DFN7_9PEZI|nr:hypothetical protein K469DRAFT_334447 [Zopfia rhizophila CBS 207.26]
MLHVMIRHPHLPADQESISLRMRPPIASQSSIIGHPPTTDDAIWTTHECPISAGSVPFRSDGWLGGLRSCLSYQLPGISSLLVALQRYSHARHFIRGGAPCEGHDGNVEAMGTKIMPHTRGTSRVTAERTSSSETRVTESRISQRSRPKDRSGRVRCRILKVETTAWASCILQLRHA